MGKKKTSSGNTSKGERRSSMKTSGLYVSNADKMLRKLDALKKGKDIVITIGNPNKAQTNKPFIKYKVSGRAYTKYVLGGSDMKGSRNPLFDLGNNS